MHQPLRAAVLCGCTLLAVVGQETAWSTAPFADLPAIPAPTLSLTGADAENPHLYLSRGVMHFKRNEIDDSAADFDRVLQLAPSVSRLLPGPPASASPHALAALCSGGLFCLGAVWRGHRSER